MDHSFLKVEAIVRNRIRSVCTERIGVGGRGREESSQCSLFPQVAFRVNQAIQSVNNDDTRLYLEAIRRDVCSVCQGQGLDGACEARQQVTCAWDAYLLLGVEATEEATGRSFHKSGIPRLIPAGPAFGPGPQIRL